MLKRLALCVVAASLAVPAFVPAASAAPVEINVVATDYAFDGIPKTLYVGKHTFNFTNASEKHVHEVFVARKKDGVKKTWQGILQARHPEKYAVVVGGTWAKPGKDGKPFTAKLKEGAHIALCFVSNSKHSEPHFMKGMSRKFKVYTPEG